MLRRMRAPSGCVYVRARACVRVRVCVRIASNLDTLLHEHSTRNCVCVHIPAIGTAGLSLQPQPHELVRSTCRTGLGGGGGGVGVSARGGWGVGGGGCEGFA